MPADSTRPSAKCAHDVTQSVCPPVYACWLKPAREDEDAPEVFLFAYIVTWSRHWLVDV